MKESEMVRERDETSVIVCKVRAGAIIDEATPVPAIFRENRH